MTHDGKSERVWHRVLGPEGLDEGRVVTVTAGKTSIALTRFSGQYGALTNACPHQGGPLGEGSIEQGAEGKCWLRCPWHGWDFNPLTGESPGGHGDQIETYPVEDRDDGIYVGLEAEPGHQRTIGDLLAESLVNNCELGKISKEQVAAEFEVWKTDLHNPNFAEFARLCGAVGIRVEKRDALDDALAEARDHNGPAMVEVMADVLLI